MLILQACFCTKFCDDQVTNVAVVSFALKGLKVGPNNGWGWSDPALLTSCFVFGLCNLMAHMQHGFGHKIWQIYQSSYKGCPISVVRNQQKDWASEQLQKNANRHSWPEWRQNRRFQSQTTSLS